MILPGLKLLQYTAAIFFLGTALSFAGKVPVVFMEPSEISAETDTLPMYQVVEDSSRAAEYYAWLNNDAADYALRLYGKAREMMEQSGTPCIQPKEFYIALVPGGNHADVGFQLKRAQGTESFPKAAYIKLGPREWRFDITLLHETGHAVMRMFSTGNYLPGRHIASIPHSTAALTDRTTAFDEGFAIHLETLIIHLSNDRHLRNKYRHEQALFGSWPGFLAEYYRQSSDLMSYSQSVARYYCIRENVFAFQSACREPDYLRVQLEKERDYSSLRNANQLLQSEGFYASFFFSMMVQGKTLPDEELLIERRDRMLNALLQTVSDQTSLDCDTPYLLRFVEKYCTMFPQEAALAVDVLLDLSHGVFIDPAAEKMWREHYLAALRLDQNMDARERIEEVRERWRTEALADFQMLYARLGPQIICTVQDVTIELPVLGQSNPLSFDINTVQPGILRLIPRISEQEIQNWMTERENAPFLDAHDLTLRAGLSADTKSHLFFDEKH